MNAEVGHARLFIYGGGTSERLQMETLARTRMADATGDALWKQPEQVKTLILEHHMAAKRLGFAEMFESLYSADSLRTSLLEGTLPAVRFFADVVLPLVGREASRR